MRPSLTRRALAMLALGLCGCDPALDWREVTLPDTPLHAELPCRPGRFERTLRVGGESVKLFMLSCEAEGVTFGLSTAELADSAKVEPLLSALLAASREAIHGQGSTVPWQPPGSTPFRGNASAHYSGLRPDGMAVEESIQVFGRGTRVYEAIAVGRSLPPAVAEPFREGLFFTAAR